MKSVKEETKMSVSDLSREELENTYGGAWWEVRVENGKIVWIFHPYDKPK